MAPITPESPALLSGDEHLSPSGDEPMRVDALQKDMLQQQAQSMWDIIAEMSTNPNAARAVRPIATAAAGSDAEVGSVHSQPILIPYLSRYFPSLAAKISGATTYRVIPEAGEEGIEVYLRIPWIRN